MKAVNIAELKNRLSHYLRAVRRGQSLLVKDRDRVIARIEPAGESGHAAGTDADRLAHLELRGVIKRGHGTITPELLARRPKVKADVVRAVLAERNEGR
jgi:antitoxin (DNA-binding transcriptional repressor) of toxin-antitoxin stability system